MSHIIIEFAKRECPHYIKIWEMQNNDEEYPIEWEREHRKELEKEFYLMKKFMAIRIDLGGDKGIHS